MLFRLFFSPTGLTMFRGHWSRMPGHLRLWPPSWTDWHIWPRSHLKLLYCEFQKDEVMTMSVVGGHPKTRKSLLWSSKTGQTLFSNLWLLLVVEVVSTWLMSSRLAWILKKWTTKGFFFRRSGHPSGYQGPPIRLSFCEREERVC